MSPCPVCVGLTAQYQLEVCRLMCERLKLSTWRVQLGVLQSMKAYFQGLLLLGKDPPPGMTALSEILTETCTAIVIPLENKSYSSVRTEALSIVELLLKKIDEGSHWESMSEKSREQLLLCLAAMETDSRPELKEKALKLRQKIQHHP